MQGKNRKRNIYGDNMRIIICYNLKTFRQGAALYRKCRKMYPYSSLHLWYIPDIFPLKKKERTDVLFYPKRITKDEKSKINILTYVEKEY